MRRQIRASLRVAAMALATLSLLPVHMIALRLGDGRAVVRLWHRWIARIGGLRVAVHGSPSRSPGTLFVANHVSYLDIPLIGAEIVVDFVSRADVADWPVIGRLAKRAGTRFVDRRVGSVRAQAEALSRHVGEGASLLIFPEGTSSDGRQVLPFRSSLLAVATAAARVQPIAIRYVGADGRPLDAETRRQVAWYGDMTLAPHLWAMLGLSAIEVEIAFLPIVTMSGFADRKALARHCQEAIAAAVAAPTYALPIGASVDRNWSVAAAQE